MRAYYEPIPTRKHGKNLSESIHSITCILSSHVCKDKHIVSQLGIVQTAWISKDVYKSYIFSPFEMTIVFERPVMKYPTQPVFDRFIEGQLELDAKVKFPAYSEPNSFLMKTSDPET